MQKCRLARLPGEAVGKACASPRCHSKNAYLLEISSLLGKSVIDRKQGRFKGRDFSSERDAGEVGSSSARRIKYKVEDGRLVVEPIPTLHDVLNEPQVVETTLGELRKFRKEISKKVES